jgi:tetratricopeptide (TPR) repeat protein
MNEGARKGSEGAAGARSRLYLLLACALPVAFFAAAELALRGAGFGGYPPLFVPVPGASGYLQPNERAIERFFATPQAAPRVSIDTTYFRRTKRPDSLRVFVQGSSTAAGFPYGKWASPAGMLGQRLQRSFPGREIEVVSTAMSAVCSYTLLDFAEEIIEQRPDAVVVYAGHNEFLGVLGVGSALSSSQSRGVTLAVMRLRRLRLYQLIERAYASLARPDPAAERSGTLMARIAGERRIPYGSDLYQRGRAQLAGNLGALLTKYRAAGIPVFLGTLASNERGRPPFASALAPATDAARWQAQYASATAALAAGDAAGAITALEAALALDDGAAEAWFALARAREAAGDYAAAREAYRAARDRDQLRFRAPGEFNDLLRALAQEHAAVLVDVEAALARESPHGIIGDDLMLEHLHPNVRGYFLLADAYFDALRERGLAGGAPEALDDARAWRENPVTEIDALGGHYRLQRLLADWPFEPQARPVALPPPATPVEEIAQAWFLGRLSWQEAMNRALVYYQRQGDLAGAAKVALNLADAFRFLDNAQYVAGQLLLRQGEVALALAHLERAVALAPRKTENLLALSHAQQLAGRRAESRASLERVLEVDPDNAQARRLLRERRP